MSQASTYLELSESGGGAHKFYEVTIAGTVVTIRYGRIGASGQTKTTAFPTAQKAQAAAARKIAEKVADGYAAAVIGQRAARPVTRRQVASAPTTARTLAPTLWRFRTGANAFGIHIGEDQCWVGNQNGDVYSLSHGGDVSAHFRLPDGVKCLVADDFWVYAGCDDGAVYDLSAKVPHAAYRIAEDVDIFWLDIRGGTLGVADRDGGLTVIDHEDEHQWSRNSSGNSAWMVRCDGDGVYHGHSKGVTAYAAEGGGQRWHTPTAGGVLFGWQEEDAVYAGTSRHLVERLAKSDGALQASYRCDHAVYSCATAPGGEYVFAGDCASSVYCFAADGTRLWKLGTNAGSALSMQYRAERLYIVTTDGSLACIDVSPQAITAAEAGNRPTPTDVKSAAALPTFAPTTSIATTTSAGTGITVECYADPAGRPRVRVVSPGYNTGWNVQFPRDIRTTGTRYVVDAVFPADGFYRVRGDIKQLL